MFESCLASPPAPPLTMRTKGVVRRGEQFVLHTRLPFPEVCALSEK